MKRRRRKYQRKQHQIAEGIPKQAPWLAEYLHEMTVFPNGRFDDQVDSTSQALDWAKKKPLVLGLVDLINREVAKRGIHSPLDRRAVLNNHRW
jgi:hypothetical protein